jgi:L-aspartate oxidase
VWTELKKQTDDSVDNWISGDARKLSEEILINHNWDSIRRVMWNYVGIVRSTERLALAKRRMEFIYAEIDLHYREYIVTPNMVELRNISLVALLIIQSAMHRKESRGLHYMMDYPEKSTSEDQTVFRKRNSENTWELEMLEGEK